MHIVSKINRLVALAVLHANVMVILERSLYAYREQNKPALWRLLSYMPMYLRSCDVIELVVLCLIG